MGRMIIEEPISHRRRRPSSLLFGWSSSMASDKGKKIAVDYDDEAVEDVRDHCISRLLFAIHILDLFYFFLFRKRWSLDVQKVVVWGRFCFLSHWIIELLMLSQLERFDDFTIASSWERYHLDVDLELNGRFVGWKFLRFICLLQIYIWDWGCVPSLDGWWAQQSVGMANHILFILWELFVFLDSLGCLPYCFHLFKFL